MNHIWKDRQLQNSHLVKFAKMANNVTKFQNNGLLHHNHQCGWIRHQNWYASHVRNLTIPVTS